MCLAFLPLDPHVNLSPTTKATNSFFVSDEHRKHLGEITWKTSRTVLNRCLVTTFDFEHDLSSEQDDAQDWKDPHTTVLRQENAKFNKAVYCASPLKLS
jgi:hypothetical protein